MEETFTHGSLCTGIGGFDLAAEWMGWKNIFHAEVDPLCCKVLKHHWPDVPNLGDITKAIYEKYTNKTRVLSAGFPCQPWSKGGQRKGTSDPRHLWPAVLGAVRAIKPVWVVGENVPGLVSWGGGLVFNQIIADLEAEGYQVQTFILPSVAIDQVHRRERLWFVAHSNEERYELLQYKSKKGRKRKAFEIPGGILTNGNEREILQRNSRDINGIPGELDSIGAFGNAISPGVVFRIYKAIEQYELFMRDFNKR